MKTYLTIQEDEWDQICLKVYGTEWVMDQLMHANPHLLHIAQFSAGTILNLPEMRTVPMNVDLPPWVKP